MVRVRLHTRVSTPNVQSNVLFRIAMIWCFLLLCKLKKESIQIQIQGEYQQHILDHLSLQARVMSLAR